MPELPSLITSLEQKRLELARLEIELKQAQESRLESLPQETGFATPDDLILALARLASPRLRELLQTFRSGGRTRHRAVVTEALRAQIAEEIRKKKKAEEIGLKFGVSASFVNQFKHKLGLTKRRGSR